MDGRDVPILIYICTGDSAYEYIQLVCPQRTTINTNCVIDVAQADHALID